MWQNTGGIGQTDRTAKTTSRFPCIACWRTIKIKIVDHRCSYYCGAWITERIKWSTVPYIRRISPTECCTRSTLLPFCNCVAVMGKPQSRFHYNSDSLQLKSISTRLYVRLSEITFAIRYKCNKSLNVGCWYVHQLKELSTSLCNCSCFSVRQIILPLCRYFHRLAFLRLLLHLKQRFYWHRLVEEIVDVAKFLLRISDNVLISDRHYATWKLALERQSRPDVGGHVIAVQWCLGDMARFGYILD